jgi:hypothetical protein
VVLTGIALLTLLFPAFIIIRETQKLMFIDSRETARVWVAEGNLPLGTKIALESYAPYVEPTDFTVQGFMKMIDHKPKWYVENGFNYLIFSQGMYGRFYKNPDAYSVEVAQYDSFFNQFTLVKMFTDGDYEVRIYETN